MSYLANIKPVENFDRNNLVTFANLFSMSILYIVKFVFEIKKILEIIQLVYSHHLYHIFSFESIFIIICIWKNTTCMNKKRTKFRFIMRYDIHDNNPNNL